MQVKALELLAEQASWRLQNVPKVQREQLQADWDISQVWLHASVHTMQLLTYAAQHMSSLLLLCTYKHSPAGGLAMSLCSMQCRVLCCCDGAPALTQSQEHL